MPKAICVVKGSLKTIIPTTIAVRGSIAPSTEVTVEPIRFIACISARFDNMVGMKANKSSSSPLLTFGRGCMPLRKDMPINTNRPPKRKI